MLYRVPSCFIVALAAMSILSACAPPIRDQQPHAYTGPQLPTSQLAVIYGNNGGDGVNLNIKAVDDVETTIQGRGARKAFVLPGRHVIHIGALAGDYFSGTLTVTDTFKPGHIYQLRHALGNASKDSRGIHLWFEDMGTDYVPPPEIFPNS